MVDDIPDIDTKPPDNVVFVCRLNSITMDDDLRIIFGRFGPIKSCEIIRDWKTGDSLQYAFIEYEDVNDCQKAYIEMENALIDDRRIHVDFSQSVAKFYWHHKGKGKFNKNKANHQRVEEANKMWNRTNNSNNGGGYNADRLKFVSVGNDSELTQKFNKSKLKKRKEQNGDGREERRRDRRKDKYDRHTRRHRSRSRSRSRSGSRERNR
eukprot:103036_1